MTKALKKVANRYGEDACMAVVDDKDSLVVIRAIANCKHMSDFDKMCLIRGYCQCINTVKDVKEELETTALYSPK